MAADDHLHELVPAYALGALDDNELAAFEQHLESCEECRAELAELRDAAVALAYAAEGPEPDPALRERILAAASAGGGRVVPFRRRWSPRWVAAAAAAACLAVGLGLWATVWTDTKSGRAQQVALPRPYVGTVAVSAEGDAELTVYNLAPAPAGKGYEVWVIDQDRAPVDAAFFRRGGRVSVTLDRKVRSGATVAMTLEQARVAAPTTKPLFAVSLPA